MPAKKKAPAKKAASTAKKKAPAKKATKPKASDKKAAPKARRTKRVPAQLRGMRDIMPKDEQFWKPMYHAAEDIAEAYGYGRIDMPLLEEAQLFVKTIGRGTDVVDKEMYVFEDKDGSKVSLRPEGTASAARAFINHGMHVAPQPVKMWYYGPMFRHDRPQAGRYRQFYQFGAEVFGEKHPVVDSELITVAYNFYRDLGINTVVHINSIGTADDRERYIIELVGYLRSKRSYLSDASKKRINKNPLRVLDSKEEQDQPIIEEAPQIIDWLSDASKKFFMETLEYLDEMGIPYVLDPTLVRGLDYYNDVVFEFYVDGAEKASQNALGGGGRYDGLIEVLGGAEPVPACGFGLGLDRVANVLKKMHEPKPVSEEEGDQPIVHTEPPKGVFLAQLGEQARRKALYIIEELRRNGITVKHNLGKSALKAQLELANKFNVSHTLILGQKEVQDGTIIIRDMESGIQEIADQKKIKHELKKILDKQA